MLNIILYIIVVLTANYTAVWFIPFPIFGMVSVGTMLFGATFTLRDRIHKNGINTVYITILITACLMVLESAFLGVSYRIILASFLAIILSETADTQVYQRFISETWYKKVAKSNAVSIPIDSTVFNLVAFYGVFAPLMLVQIIFGEIVTKGIIGGIVALKKSA